jgi:hypothetical protein
MMEAFLLLQTHRVPFVLVLKRENFQEPGTSRWFGCFFSYICKQIVNVCQGRGTTGTSPRGSGQQRAGREKERRRETGDGRRKELKGGERRVET